MTPRDPFAEGQATTEELRQAVAAIREDVRAVVRQEIAEAGMPESELEHLVAELVREELATATKRSPRRSAAVLVATGVGLGLLVGAVGYRALTGTAGQGTRSARAGQEAAGDPDTGEPSAASVGGSGGLDASARGSEARPAGPQEADATNAGGRAGRYDELVRTGAPQLGPLLTDLEGAAAAPVRDAVASWRSGETLEPEAAQRFHDALVQAAVNRLTGAGLTLDGRIARDPCVGASCEALLRLWQRRGAEWGLPPYPASAGARTVALPVVERLLVLAAVEAPDG